MRSVRVSVQYGDSPGEVEAFYFQVTDHKVARTREWAEEILVDVDSRGNLVGVEILNVEDLEALHAIAREYDVPELRKIVKVKSLEAAFA
jgi:uncharacterized protein YuzE